MQPVRLECEARSNPLGVDAAQPRLSWVLESAEKGQRQTAYRILVASKPELLQPGHADLWDSGEVLSEETINIVYAGKALESNQRCFWQVQARDRAGVWTKAAAIAEWTMGLLKRERELFALWNKDTRFSGIVLESVALSQEVGYLKLSYEFNGWERYVESKRAAQNKVF